MAALEPTCHVQLTLPFASAVLSCNPSTRVGPFAYVTLMMQYALAGAFAVIVALPPRIRLAGGFWKVRDGEELVTGAVAAGAGVAVCAAVVPATAVAKAGISVGVGSSRTMPGTAVRRAAIAAIVLACPVEIAKAVAFACSRGNGMRPVLVGVAVPFALTVAVPPGVPVVPGAPAAVGWLLAAGVWLLVSYRQR